MRTIPNINTIFDREKIANEIKLLLSTFDENCKNVKFKKGFISMVLLVVVKPNLS